MEEALKERILAKSFSKKRIGIVLLYFVISVITLVIFSWNTSPFFKFFGYDSGIFKSMGQFFAQGLVPYKEFFDHKGPVVLLVEYITYGIFKSDFALLILQSIFLTATLCASYKTAKLFLSEKKSILSAFIVILFYGIYMCGQGGNLVEEWNVPFIAWSLYFAIKFFADINSIEHKTSWSAFYGVTIGICAFTRLSNAMPVVVFIIVIVVYLIKNKKWSNLFKNLLFIIIGIMVIAIPIIIWFAINGGLNDMLYATFVFNFKYIKSRGMVADSLRLVKHFLRYMLPFVVVLVMQIKMLIKRYEMAMNACLVIQTLVAIVMQMVGPLFPHYLLIWVPVLAATFFVFLKKGETYEKKDAILLRVCFASIVLIFVVTVGISFYRYFDYLKDNAVSYENVCNDINKHLPEDAYDKTVAYNVNSQIYLTTGIKTCYTYFHTQDMHGHYDSVVRKQIDKEFASLKAKYIIVNRIVNYPRNSFLRKYYNMKYKNKYLAILEKKSE